MNTNGWKESKATFVNYDPEKQVVLMAVCVPLIGYLCIRVDVAGGAYRIPKVEFEMGAIEAMATAEKLPPSTPDSEQVRSIIEGWASSDPDAIDDLDALCKIAELMNIEVQPRADRDEQVKQQARAVALEEVIEIVADFDDWEVDAKSHAVDTQQSLAALATEIRQHFTIPEPPTTDEKETTPNPS